MIADIETAERVVRRALSHYGSQSEGDLTFVKYRENWVFRVDHAEGSYAVRVHRLGYRSDEELREELDLITALRRAQLPVPVVRQTIDGGGFCHIADEEGDVYQVDLLEWIHGGEPLGDIGDAFSGDATIDAEAFRRLGALAALLHQETARLAESRHSVRAAWDCEGLVGKQPIWGDPLRAFAPGDPETAIVASAIERLMVELTRYATVPQRCGPIHADLTPENVMVCDGTMSIIDFDDSGDGYYLFDLATAAFFYLPHPEFGAVEQALLEGYGSVCPLHEADLAMWRPMLLARGLTYLGWATDRLGDETSDFVLEHVRPVVVELCRELATSPEQSLASNLNAL